jgi:uncharacterized protein (DUF433 family)
MKNKQKLLKRITINQAVMNGKPTISGTNLTVQHIIGLLAQGMTTQEILHQHCQLKHEDVSACLLFVQEALDTIVFAPIPSEGRV